MKWIAYIARVIVGILFIFSGLIKLNDPVGTAIKFEEYFDVFSRDISGFFIYFVPYSLFLSVALSVLEVILGLAVIIWFRMKSTAWFLLLLILFFTFLTFYSAYFNKVTDCGCFGDAIKLTPWQSFIKDIILLVLVLVLFVKRDIFEPFLTKSIESILIIASIIVTVSLAIYAINFLPFIDFRAYKVGANIPELMQASAPLSYKYNMTRAGKTFEFDQYPSDTTYHYQSMELVNPEAQAKITDYNIWNDDGDFTQESFTGSKLFIIIYNSEKAGVKDIQDINALVSELNKGIEVWAITASDQAQFEDFRHTYNLAIPYYYGDATVLKTIIRANPGLVLMKDGVVKGKWSHNAVPTATEIKELL